MGTFTIIVLIIAFIAGITSRSKPTITLDNDNHHLFSNPSKHHNPSINRDELMDRINNENEKKNYREVIRLCEKYIYYYN